VAFSDAFLDDLRARLAVSVVVGKSMKLRKEGKEFRAVDDNSLTVNDQKQIWWDHGADKGGDIFKWFEEREGCTFPEAVERCAALAGVSIPTGYASGGERPNGSRANGSARAHSQSRDDREGPPPDERPAARSTAARSDGNPPGRPVTRREIVATFDYTTPQGDLLYQVVRWQLKLPDGSWDLSKKGKPKKIFSQRRPSIDEDGVWIWGLDAGDYMRRSGGDWYRFDEENWRKWSCTEMRAFDAVPHGLYRLVELREVGADETVYMPEGEPKVDLLWEWGLPATCNSGGAKNWRPEHAEFFRDRDVVILQDNDKPGRERSDIIGRDLRRVARRVRALDFSTTWPDAPEGADIVDWKRHREGTAEELQELVAKLAEWQPPPFVSRFGGIPFECLDDPGPEHEYLIDDWLTVGDKSIIGGASKSGKSFLAIHAAMSISLGIEFFGNKVLTPGLVIYQAGEGARGIKKRFRAWRQYFGVPVGKRVPVYILQSKIDLYSAQGDTNAFIEEVNGISQLYDVPLRALFIDTLAKAQGGADENSGRDMSIVMANIDRIAAAVPGCHVALVHHFNAAGTKLRGHSSIYANIDQVVLVTKDEESKVRTALLDKQKDGEDGATIKFELMQVELGRRAVDGKPITSCVTLSVGGKAAAKAEGKNAVSLQLSDQQTNIVNALKKAITEHGEDAPASLGLPKSIKKVVRYKQWLQAYRDVWPGDPTTDDAAIRQAMKRAGEKLIRLKVIGRVNPYVWLTGRAVAGAVEGLARYGESQKPTPRAEELPLPEGIEEGDL
jgi:hypothetical protein